MGRTRSDAGAEDLRREALADLGGAGDFLPPYSGNLDIMTAAATKVGESFATQILGASV